MDYSKTVLHWLGDQEAGSQSKKTIAKFNPATGEVLAEVICGDRMDVEKAISLAEKGYAAWSATLVQKRAEVLKRAALILQDKKEEIASIVALESGKPKKIALAEVEAAIKCGLYLIERLKEFNPLALESAVPNRKLYLARASIGVGALITPFNNPMAGIAWKTFPALLSGNAVVVKSHSYVPYTAVWFGKVLKDAGLPAGVFSALQGDREGIGRPLVEDKRIKFVSLTGSLPTGQFILKATADRLTKVCIEAGGKNPFVVCDDADLEKSVACAAAGSFVDAGQRCAATSRIIIFEKVYEEFKKRFLGKVKTLKVGISDSDDFGAIISQQRLDEILKNVEAAISSGAKLLCGGKQIEGAGYFMEPIVLENVSADDEISKKELFGPVVVLYKVKSLKEAIDLANNSEFKLSGAIHTSDMRKADEFIKHYVAGVVRVNGPTHGSEPHAPFGGVGLSGNGWREPGVKSLDFYSDWKQVSIDL